MEAPVLGTTLMVMPGMLLRWRQLSDVQRQRGWDMALLLARRMPNRLIDLADQYGRLYPICDNHDIRARALRACQSHGWTPADDADPSPVRQY